MALLVAGCNKVEMVEAPVEEPVVESPDHLIVDITVGTEGDTRAVKTGWETGDKIYVFFDHFFLDYVSDPNIGTNGEGSPKYSDQVCYLTLTYDGSAWHSDFSQDALETYLSGRSSGTLAAVYYQHLNPEFRCLHAQRNNREDFYVDVQNIGNHSGFYMFTQGDTYTVSHGRLSATLNMHLHELAVHLVVPGMPGSSRFGAGLRCDQFVSDKPDAIVSTSWNGADFQAPEVQTSTSNVLYPTFESSQMVFDGRLRSAGYQGQEMEYVLQLSDKRTDPSLKDDLYYTLTKTTALYGKDAIKLPVLNSLKWVKSYQHPCEDRGFLDGVEWVLMGDGRKWAMMDYGAYDTYSDAYAEGSGGWYSKWASAPNLFRNWGNGWRLPTADEWSSLLTSANTRLVRVFDEERGFFRGVRVERWNDTGEYRVEHIMLAVSPYLLDDGVSVLFYGEPDGFYWTGTTDPSDNTSAKALRLFAEGSPDYGFISLGMNHELMIRAILDE